MLKAQVTGYIGKDAVIKNAQNGSFYFFSVAVKGLKDDEESTWVNITTRNDKIVPFLKKGTLVYIDGYLNCNVFIDKNNTPRASMNINSVTIELLKKPEKELAGNSAHTDDKLKDKDSVPF